MRIPPPEVIASWPTPNYIDPKDVRGNELLIVSSVFFPLALAMVALRMYTRLRISKCFGVDDVLLLMAVFPSGCIAISTVLSVTKWGWDRHIWDVPLHLITVGLKMTSKSPPKYHIMSF